MRAGEGPNSLQALIVNATELLCPFAALASVNGPESDLLC